MRRILIPLLLCLTLLSAQNLTLRVDGKPVKSTTEFAGRRDASGRLCAAIRVLSDLQGLSYDAYNGVVGEVTRQPGADLVYVSANERVLEVFCTGYDPLKIILSEHGITLKEKEIWQIRVTGDKKAVNVTILSDPPDAEKILNDKPLGTGETFKVIPGQYTLRLRKTGYRGVVKTIVISDENTLFRGYKLEQIDDVPVTINSTPAGATVYIDGMQKGKTPFSDFLYPETYTVRLVLPGYVDIEQTISVKEEGENRYPFNLIRNIATLNVALDPIDAVLMLNDRKYATGKIELPAGYYKIEATREGYLSRRDSINLKIGDSVTRSYQLVKNSGVITLTVQPADASVLINNQDYGARRSFELTPGRYQIDVRQNGYLGQTKTIDLKIGDNIRDQFTLIKNSGVITLTVQPADASVLINNQDYGAQREFELPPGNYQIEAMRSGYLSQTDTLQLNRGDKISRSYVLIKNTGTLALAVQPSDALLKINRKPYGTRRQFELTPGLYKIELEKEGYSPVTEVVEVVRDEMTVREFQLERQLGSLQFKITPHDAAVSMRDDQRGIYQTWQGLKLLKDVPVGDYTLEASHPDYLSAARAIRIAHDQRLQVEMTLLTYAGSIQQEIDRIKFKRNLNLAATGLLAVTAGILQLAAGQTYDRYLATQSSSEALKLYDQACNLSRLAGYTGIAAGISATPIIKWQMDISIMAQKIEREAVQ